MILLDTNILIDLGRHSLDEQETYAASILSRAELELGIHRSADTLTRTTRQRYLRRLDEYIEWLIFDHAASQGYGVVAGGVRVTGARLRNKDALIAGQAYSLGLPLMTHNTADFAPFASYIVLIEPTVVDDTTPTPPLPLQRDDGKPAQ